MTEEIYCETHGDKMKLRRRNGASYWASCFACEDDHKWYQDLKRKYLELEKRLKELKKK